MSLLGISSANAEGTPGNQPLRTPQIDRLDQLQQFGLQLEQQVLQNGLTQLEAGARLADFAAQLYYDPSRGAGSQDIRGFVRALAQVGGGLNPATLQRNSPRLANFRAAPSGFRADLLDGSPQAEHFYGSLYAAYIGSVFGYEFMNSRERRPQDRPDRILNAYALVAARQLRNRVLDIRQLGNFIRENLGPPSP